MVEIEQTFSINTEFTEQRFVNITASTSSRSTLRRKPDLTYDLEMVLDKLMER